jgi:hypothetical protein
VECVLSVGAAPLSDAAGRTKELGGAESRWGEGTSVRCGAEDAHGCIEDING